MRRPNFRLLVRYYSSTCSDKERARVERWVNASSSNKERFERSKAIWDLSASTENEWDPQARLQRITAKMAETGSVFGLHKNFRLFRIDPRPEPRGFSLGNFVIASLVVTVLIGTVGAVYYLKQRAEQQEALRRAADFTIEEISTKPGQHVAFDFADGTKVFLNSETQLRYRTDPSGSRDVFLKGEAYFEVNHSDHSPLVVHVGDALIRDLGTKFDVKAWPGDGTAQVTVAEGVVSVLPVDLSRKPVIIKRGQYSVFNRNHVIVPPTYVDVSQELQWMKGRLVFHDDRFGDVIRQLRRQFGIRCFVADSSMLSKTLTASFGEREPIKRVLDIIALSLGLQYRASKDSVLFVYPKQPFTIYKSAPSTNTSYQIGGSLNEVHILLA